MKIVVFIKEIPISNHVKIDPETNNILAVKKIWVDKNSEEQKVDNLNNTPFEEYKRK